MVGEDDIVLISIYDNDNSEWEEGSSEETRGGNFIISSWRMYCDNKEIIYILIIFEH